MINLFELDPLYQHRYTPKHLNTPSIYIYTRMNSHTSPPLDMEDPVITHQLLQIIQQFLSDKGMHQTASMLNDETDAFVERHQKVVKRSKRLQTLIMAGEWAEVHKMFAKFVGSSRKHQRLQFSLYKQQYFEFIETQEFQKALTFLNKYLKPFSTGLASHSQDDDKEFSDLCVLLTCKSVRECHRYNLYPGTAKARENLSSQIESLTTSQGFFSPDNHSQEIPPHRLVSLVEQAVSYQLLGGVSPPSPPKKIESIVNDYQSHLLPNHNLHSITELSSNVKCIEFIGLSGSILASSSSDCTIRLWDISQSKNTRCISTLVGHKARIWDLSSFSSGNAIVSGSSDGTVRLWDISQTVPWAMEGNKNKHREENTSTLLFDNLSSDIYAVQVHPDSTQVLFGGYDRKIRLTDIESQSTLQTLISHSSSVTSLCFNQQGRIVVSGSKDRSTKLWDLSSGVCIKSLNDALGEISSVQLGSNGSSLLTSSKDNCHRLWDIRKTSEPLQRYRGHQNTYSNFIRSAFGPSEEFILSGSENGQLCIWETASGTMLQVNPHTEFRHSDTVYQVKWNANQSLMASCSNDGTVKTWNYQE